MIKVSFDFDSTLSRFDVQKFVSSLKDVEIHIVTSRYNSKPENWTGAPIDNSDLFIVARKLNIPISNIHFTNQQLKYKFFKNKDFLFHLDDDYIELIYIQKKTNVKAISVLGNWKPKLKKLLK